MAQAPDLHEIARLDGRYRAEAFAFVNQSLRHAARTHGKDQVEGAERHLTAQQLVDAAIDLASDRFGLLGQLVLRRWGLRSSDDIGAITFALIDHGIFTKRQSDRIEDFYGGPDFASDIERRVRERLALAAPPARPARPAKRRAAP